MLRLALLQILLLTLSLAATAADCTATDPSPGLGQLYSSGWGIDHSNTRYQSASRTGIRASNVQNLQLKWVYGLSTDQPRSYPLVTEDTIFIGNDDKLVALDRANGCTRWEFMVEGQIGSAIAHGTVAEELVLYFADRRNGIFAVKARDGAMLWSSAPGDNPVPLYSGSPLVAGGMVFVPLSSLEIGLSINPFYGCCTTHGGMAALDAATGESKWFVPTVAEAPQLTGRHFLLVEEWGPSGAPVWGAPTFDEKRGLLYFGTGQNYSRPATLTSDAVIAVDIRDGSVRWTRQFTAGDAFNMACSVSSNHVNCPQPPGPDVDVGAPPILVTALDGTDLLMVGQKSGELYAVSPDTGEILWQRRLGRGGALGGIHWGMAANPGTAVLYVPISDVGSGPFTGADEAAPGLYAIELAKGGTQWVVSRQPDCAERKCWPGLSAAIIVSDELIFAGSLDGKLDAIDAVTGKTLWRHDSVRDYAAVNGIATHGGSFDAHGPMLADNLLIVSSGYGSFGQQGGNALLVFELAAAAEGEAP